MTATERQDAHEFALRVYQNMKHNRAYALTDATKMILGALGKSVLLRRAALSWDAKVAAREMEELIGAARCIGNKLFAVEA